jgi:hypothetical protein
LDITNRMQFFVNMIIAGIIIFGGGPVVVPLLRGYTVDNGMYLPPITTTSSCLLPWLFTFQDGLVHVSLVKICAL